MTNNIYGPDGKLIAILEDNKRIYKPGMVFIGYYNQDLNQTFYADGKLAGQGNILMLLI